MANLELKTPQGGSVTLVPENGTDNVQAVIPQNVGELYGRGNAVGTVSQSGGVPTGAIIQRGSNANGSFVRYADGTQITVSRKTIIENVAAGGPFQLLATPFAASFVSSPDIAHIFSDIRMFTSEFRTRDLYSTMQSSFVTDRIICINTGRSPQQANPSFNVLGTEQAGVVDYTVTTIGRWF